MGGSVCATCHAIMQRETALKLSDWYRCTKGYSGAQASDPPKQKTRPLFNFKSMTLNTVKNRNFTIQLTFRTIVQIGCALKILDWCTEGYSGAPGSDPPKQKTRPLFSVTAVTLTWVTPQLCPYIFIRLLGSLVATHFWLWSQSY